MHEKAELVFYQKDAVEEDIKLIVKKINTTQISVTFSIKMAIDIVDRKIMVDPIFFQLSGDRNL